jgi:type II secretory pathway component PulF
MGASRVGVEGRCSHQHPETYSFSIPTTRRSNPQSPIRNSMSPRAKQQLYHSLAELLRAGITFPRALEKLKVSLRGPARKLVNQIARHIERGHTVAEACAAAQPTISPMEAAVLTAVERAGSLDRGLEQLSNHFGAVRAARGQMISKLAYPAFLLVLGVLVLNLPEILRHGVRGYLGVVGVFFGALIFVLFALTLVRNVLAAAATFSPAADRLVRVIPVIGGMQRAFAMNRFCLAYNLQLEAGINTLDALKASAAASRSGLVRGRVRSILGAVRQGAQVGPLLAEGDAFDPEVTQDIIVGEETGRLDRQLQQLATEQERKAFARLDALAEWGPRLTYLAILIYLGYMIVKVYASYLNQVLSIGGL